jgi:flavin-dependent thymidylate synthase
MTQEMSAAMMVAIQSIHQQTLDTYNRLLEQGVCREQARGILPQNLMTEFYMTGNLRNWMHFCDLRLHEGAQKEARDIANQCLDLLYFNFPEGARAIRDAQIKMPMLEWVDKFFSNSNVSPDVLEKAYKELAGVH